MPGGHYFQAVMWMISSNVYLSFWELPPKRHHGQVMKYTVCSVVMSVYSNGNINFIHRSFYFYFTGMCQLPEFKQFPLYHPSMTFSQVIPKLSSRGRDLLQVIKRNIIFHYENYKWADLKCVTVPFINISAFIDLQPRASAVCRWVDGAPVFSRS